MGFFKKVKQKINGMWYPQSITVGKPVTTDEVAKRLAIESTVSPADTFAVLKSIPISSGKNGAENPLLPAKVAVAVKGEERLPIRQHKAGCFSGAIKRTGSCTAKGLFCIAKGSFRHCRTTL